MSGALTSLSKDVSFVVAMTLSKTQIQKTNDAHLLETHELRKAVGRENLNENERLLPLMIVFFLSLYSCHQSN